ncbi:CG31226 [Drosophila busckii]|uniref:CG31226 n=1 Tax=Drosophila busckii TaxID=30019 RepID=A0A0M4E078_DROBS|nr:male-specific sperm protein Mst84Da [Drosophila busckii]ALC38441.1 maker430 [Drosophila busckii]ALC40370.1 CG31226 [Drosophila busckii]
MCQWPCYPAACLGSCGGCGPSGFYDPSFGPFNGPFNSRCGPCCPAIWRGAWC